MEQASVKDVEQLIDTMVSNRKVDDMCGLGGVRIDEVELAVYLRNHIVRQSHCNGWYAKGKGILGTREHDGVFEPKKCHAPIGAPEPDIEPHFTKQLRN